jgi:L-threonylcarbamoyladenylate synthase
MGAFTIFSLPILNKSPYPPTFNPGPSHKTERPHPTLRGAQSKHSGIDLTEILKLDLQNFHLRNLEPAVKILLAGGIVAGATGSFYGLMALPDRPLALEKVARLKGPRSEDDAFLLLVDCIDRVSAYAQEIPPEAEILMEKFWPGLLTILFKAQGGLHSAIMGKKKGTVGLRLDGCPLSAQLCRMADRAVTGTSANPHGSPPAHNSEMLLSYFKGKLDMVIDTGPTPGGKPSTIIDLSKAPFSIIREGALGGKGVLSVLPPCQA